MVDTGRQKAGSERESDDFRLSRRGVLALAGATSIVALPSAAQPGSAEGGKGETMQVTLRTNGETHRLDLDPRQSLLDVLRDRLDLTGTKKGCNQGACGACTVLANGRRIVSCLTLAAMYDGAEITTIEGLASQGELHPLQAAFVEHEALQCGFCTPGQIMSGVACIAEGHAGSPDEIRAWMSGNICRCAAYPGIVAAIGEAGRVRG